MLKKIAIAATALGVTATVGLTAASAQQRDITGYAGSVGGLYMETMAVWVDLWEDGIEGVSITPVLGGGTTNPLHVATEDPNSAIGITDTISTVDAWNGTGDIGKRAPDGLQNLRALYRFNAKSYSAFGIRASDLPEGVETVGELLEKKPALTWTFMQRGNPGELTGRRILEAYGVSLDDLRDWGGSYSFNPHAEIGSLMIDGHADVFMVLTRAPAAFMLDMDASISDLTFLPIEDEIIAKVADEYGGYIKTEHPAEDYGLIEEPVNTLASDHLVFVHQDMDEELAYQLTRIALENDEKMSNALGSMETFSAEEACTDTGSFPLHPGAERACRELGLMN